MPSLRKLNYPTFEIQPHLPCVSDLQSSCLSKSLPTSFVDNHSQVLNLVFDIHIQLGGSSSRLDLPNVEVLACLVLPLTLSLVHLVQLQHGLTGLRERNDQLAHTMRLHEALGQTCLVVGDIIRQLHAP